MRTKIIATLGPVSNNRETIRELALAGARIFRLNFSHAAAATFADTIATIRSIESEIKRPLTAMGDLCGPKTRIGELKGSPLQVNKGDHLLLGLPEAEPKNAEEIFMPLQIPELLHGLRVGMPVNLSDGLLQFEVTKVWEADRLFELKSKNAGILTSKKGIAFPGKNHPMPALTDKDIQDLHDALDIGINSLAISFVQSQEDVATLKKHISDRGKWVPVIAKLERQNAVDRLDSILDLTDIVMVARGDLGQECPISELPIIQKRIIRACRHAQKPSIVATQMLLSMVNNPIPTRAESSDVANAILDGADCVMLSEETAIGNYPVEAVRCMNEIAGQAEAYFLERVQGPYAPKKEKNPAKYLAYAACLMADNTDSIGLVSHSVSGATVRLLSSRRPAQPIYGLTSDETKIHYVNFAWGVRPRLVPETQFNHMDRAEAFVQASSDFLSGSSVVITAGQPTPGQKEQHTNQIKVYYK